MTLTFNQLSFVDLTHSLTPSIPHWSGHCGFQPTILSDYDDSSTDTKFRLHSINMRAGIGTHMDAPLHCIPEATDIADITLKQLIAPCIVIDVSAKADETYQVTTDDIHHFEKQHGVITKNALVIIRTGWDKFWSTPEKYRNQLRFPTISLQAAELLLEREMVGLGIDTLSPDTEASGFPVHRLVLGANKYIIENVANADLLPVVGACAIALPLKIQGGTESPIRLIAAMDKK